MYCQKCGKENDNGELLCNDCLKKMVVEVAPVEAMGKEEIEEARKVGRKTALASTIVSNASIFAMLIAFFIFVMGVIFCFPSHIEEVPSTYAEGITMFVVGTILFFASIAGLVVSLVLGVKSINVYRTVVAEGKPKPIATLILGIVGLASSIEGLFVSGMVGLYWFVFFMALLMA